MRVCEHFIAIDCRSVRVLLEVAVSVVVSVSFSVDRSEFFIFCDMETKCCFNDVGPNPDGFGESDRYFVQSDSEIEIIF